MQSVFAHFNAVLLAAFFLNLEGSANLYAAARQETFKVTRRLPHDPDAYTQGLVFLDGKFIEGTGIYGRSSLRLVDVGTGTVNRQIPLAAQYFGEGVAVAGNAIVQLTWRHGIAFIYDLESFDQVGSIRYAGEGWGLTFDGKRFVMSNGSSSITFRDPTNFSFLSNITVTDDNTPVRNLNELEWINGEIWANQWQTDRIARISPDTGEVLAWIDLEGIFDWQSLGNADAVLNGIAYDAATDRLFVTGKLWPWIFEIKVAEQGLPDATEISIATPVNDALSITFPTFKNASYLLERLTDLNPTTQAITEDTITGTGHPITRTLPVLQDEQAFYRIVGLPLR
jgi:glutamine cyclotransferase